jgi:hypothetical protein
MIPPKIKAICNTLAASVQSGLNANLTPDDCRELLHIVLINTRAAIAKPAPITNQKRKSLDRIVEGVADIAAGFVEDIAAEFQPPRRRKREP